MAVSQGDADEVSDDVSDRVTSDGFLQRHK